VPHACCRKAKASDGPVEVRRPVIASKRHALAQSSFVNLDHAGTRRFQVDDFISDRQRNLGANVATPNVVANEGPIEDGHWPGQDRFYGLFGERLRVSPPCDSHGPRSRYVTK